MQAAAWHSPGSLQFEIGSASQTGHVAGAQSGSAVTVRAVTLDDMLAELKLDRVDFIKMDIEGAERHALAGAHQLLAAGNPDLRSASTMRLTILLPSLGSYERRTAPTKRSPAKAFRRISTELRYFVT